MNKKELWQRLKVYHFDHVVAPGLWEHITAKFGHSEPSVRAFAGKIARKHDWKNRFALKALTEYKKFVYLGIVSDFQVTPSKVIDTVWHEHLLFSKAYRDFCNDVIRQSFDHHPELLPVEDQTGRFSAQYLDTIELYKKEFSIDPPADIWGDTKFDKDQQKNGNYQSGKKQKNGNSSSDYSGEAPLYTYFSAEPAASHAEFIGFGDGDFGGAGASGDWSGSDGGSDGDGGGCSGGCGGGGD